jgi:hypothetical protein
MGAGSLQKNDTDAYVPTGTAVRYQLSRDTKAFIRHFDETGSYPPGITAEILPLPPTRRLGVRSKERGAKAPGTPHVRVNPESTLPTRGRCEPILPAAPADGDQVNAVA